MGEGTTQPFLALSKATDRSPDKLRGDMNLVEEFNLTQHSKFARDLDVKLRESNNSILHRLPGDTRFYSNTAGWLAPLAMLAPSRNPPSFKHLSQRHISALDMPAGRAELPPDPAERQIVLEWGQQRENQAQDTKAQQGAATGAAQVGGGSSQTTGKANSASKSTRVSPSATRETKRKKAKKPKKERKEKDRQGKIRKDKDKEKDKAKLKKESRSKEKKEKSSSKRHKD